VDAAADDRECSMTTAIQQKIEDKLMTRAAWKEQGYRVPTKATPAEIELYLVPGYRSVYRERHLFSFEQVKKVSKEEADRRSASATLGVITRTLNMEAAMENVALTIVRGMSDREIYDLARATHGGNYAGKPGEFHWSNRKARNAIRHCLTNYESQWAKINRGATGEDAYTILRERVDQLVDEAYPQFAEGMPEVAICLTFRR
jgi:hypothetical protein